MTLPTRDPKKRAKQLRAWRTRGTKAYEDRLRQEHGCPFRPVGTNPERRKRESERAYGPPERREYITRHLPCVGCGRRPTEDHPNHQHHVRSGGTGRKADAETIVSLCVRCHRLEHDGNGPAVDWEGAARETEERWQRYQREGE